MRFNLPFEVGNKRKYKVVSDDVVMLTQRGKEAAESDAHSGGRAVILMALNDRGSVSINELANDTRLPVDKVKDIIVDLMNRTQVRKVGFED